MENGTDVSVNGCIHDREWRVYTGAAMLVVQARDRSDRGCGHLPGPGGLPGVLGLMLLTVVGRRRAPQAKG